MKDFQYKPLVSVIVPIFNSEKYLHKCLDSLIHQTYTNIEIICIDDCSADNSSEIVSRHINIDSRIILLKNEKNSGSGYSRNKGIENSKGEYILFLDSDDWLTDDAVEQLIECLNNHKDLDIVSYLFYDVDGKSGKITLEQEIPETINNKVYNINNNPLSFVYLGFGTTKLIRKTFLSENNIRFNKYNSLEDMDFFFKLITTADKILFTDKVLLYYRHCTDSRSTQSYKYLDYHFTFLKMAENVIKDFPDSIKILCLQKMYRVFMPPLFKAFSYFYISYAELQNILSDYINPLALNSSDLKYYHLLYEKIVVQKRSMIYLRTLFTIKTFFPAIFNFYKTCKEQLQLKR